MKNRKIRQLLSLTVALVLIGSVSILGAKMYLFSDASTGATISIDPASGSYKAGENVAVSIKMDSGNEPVNAVQASLTYNPNQLQYVSVTESGSFPLAAATSTESGVVRVARGVQEGDVRGRQTVVTVNFKALSAAGPTSVSLDPAYSFIVRSSDSQNILGATSGGLFSIDGGSQPIDASRPVFTMNPTSGSYTPGSTVAVSVRLRSDTALVTTVQPIIQYPADTLEYVGVTEGGVFSTVQRTKNTNGTLDVIRGVAGGNAGVKGEQPIVTVNFKVLAEGAATLSFGNTSAAFDNSGTGKNVLNLAASTSAAYNLSTTGPRTPQTGNGGSKPLVVVAKPGGRADMSAKITQVQGEVEILPVVDQAILQKTPGDTITKVEYYIGKKLIATETTPPFVHSFDTRPYKNGEYNITIKTYYRSGTVADSKDQLMVTNPVNASYVAKHYGIPVAAVVIIMTGMALVAWRFLLPRFKGSGNGPAAGPALATAPVAGVPGNSWPATPAATTLPSATTPSSDLQAGRRFGGGPVAAAPTVIAPTNIAPAVQVSPPVQGSVQATAALPVQNPVSPVAAQPVPVAQTALAPSTVAAPPAPTVITPTVIRPTVQPTDQQNTERRY